MKIKNIEIDGYRSLKNVKINDLSDINIFHGENNTGKSNILKALEVFFSEKYIFKPLISGKPGEAEVKGETREIGFEGKVPIEESDFYTFEKGSIKFYVELELDNKDIGVIKIKLEKKEFSALLQKKSILLKITAEIPFDLEEHDNISYANFTISSFKINNKDTTDRVLIDKIGMYLILRFSNINSERQIVREIYRGEEVERIGVKNIQKYLYNLSLSDRVKDRLILEEIMNKFNEINKDVGKITFSIKRSKPEEDIKPYEGGAQIIKIKDVSEIKLMMISTKNELLLPIENFGSGLQQSLIIIANVVANNNAILYGIEELEANLSPHNQEIIFNTIKKMMTAGSFNINQVFITSHSDVFSKDKVKDAKVYMVKFDGKKTSIAESERIEYVKFFRPYQDDYVKDKLNKLYEDHGIGTDNSIDEMYAKATIMEHIVDEIEKEEARNDKQKIDEIFKQYQKKIGKEWKITKEQYRSS